MNRHQKLKHNSLFDAWQEYDSVISSDDHQISRQKIETLQASFFCPGPFYVYVIDFPSRSFTYLHPNARQILGVDPDSYTLEEMIGRIHPEDMPFMADAERLTFDFIMNRLPKEKRMKYKQSYSVRVKVAGGDYRLFLEQAVAVTLDEEGNLGKVLGVHSDISHITRKNNYTVSFIGMEGEPSYFGIDPSEVPRFIPESGSAFTEREIHIIKLLAEGLRTGEIAQKLFLSEETVKTHRKNILNKDDSRNIIQVVAKCIREGII